LRQAAETAIIGSFEAWGSAGNHLPSQDVAGEHATNLQVDRALELAAASIGLKSVPLCMRT